MRYYIALIRKDENSAYGVEFPDFPGCISAGDPLQDTAQSARKALALHVEGLVEDGEFIPEPSQLEDIDSEGAVATLVPLSETPGRVVRLNITMDETLLKAIDETSRREGMSRSAYLAHGARLALRASH